MHDDPTARTRRDVGALGWRTLPLLLVVGVGAFLLFAAWMLRHRPYEGSFHRGASEGELSLRYTGVAGFEISDAETTILLDPVVTRPRFWELIAGPLQPDTVASREVFPRADYILIQHAHYDHVIDTPEIAARTGAVVVGSRSVANLMRSRGLPEQQILEAEDGQELTLGSFEVRTVKGRHGAIYGVQDPMGGLIPADAGPLWFFQYRNDELYNYRLEARGISLWSNFPGQDVATPSNVVLFMADEPLPRARWQTILATTGARIVIPMHFDNFFQPRALGLNLLPGNRSLLGGDWNGASPDLAQWLVLDYDQRLGISAGDSSAP